MTTILSNPCKFWWNEPLIFWLMTACHMLHYCNNNNNKGCVIFSSDLVCWNCKLVDIRHIGLYILLTLLFPQEIPNTISFWMSLLYTVLWNIRYSTYKYTGFHWFIKLPMFYKHRVVWNRCCKQKPSEKGELKPLNVWCSFRNISKHLVFCLWGNETLYVVFWLLKPTSNCSHKNCKPKSDTTF